MSHPKFSTFQSLFDEANRLYQYGDLAAALELATEGQTQFPDDNAPLYLLRATLKARIGDIPAAMELLSEAITQKNYWYPDARWQSDAFSKLHASPEFIRLRATSNEREAAAQAEAKPQIHVQKPDTSAATDADKPGPLPLIMALHGNGANTRYAAPFWNEAVKLGWMVALPQSPHMIGYESYAWSDYEQDENQLITQYDTLRQTYTIDPEQVIFAGKSQGAETVLRMVLSGTVKARGFIAIVPSGPFTLRPAQWEPLVQSASRSLRGYIVAGGREAHFATGIWRLVEMLRAKHMKCALDIHPGLRHEYPPNFRSRLPFMLEYVLREDKE